MLFRSGKASSPASGRLATPQSGGRKRPLTSTSCAVIVVTTVLMEEQALTAVPRSALIKVV